MADARVWRGKVPRITGLFWVVTALTAGVGQTASDWLIGTGNGLPGLGLGGALGIEVGLFVLALALQFTVRRYLPPVYWLALAGISVIATVVADVMHFLIGLPLSASSATHASVLVVNFLLWYRAERSLSIHSIRTRRREASYWVTALFMFALGTAVVDLVTTVWHLGLLASAVTFLVLILVPAGVFARFGDASVLLFWAGWPTAVVARGPGAYQTPAVDLTEADTNAVVKQADRGARAIRSARAESRQAGRSAAGTWPYQGRRRRLSEDFGPNPAGAAT